MPPIKPNGNTSQSQQRQYKMFVVPAFMRLPLVLQPNNSITRTFVSLR